MFEAEIDEGLREAKLLPFGQLIWEDPEGQTASFIGDVGIDPDSGQPFKTDGGVEILVLLESLQFLGIQQFPQQLVHVLARQHIIQNANV